MAKKLMLVLAVTLLTSIPVVSYAAEDNNRRDRNRDDRPYYHCCDRYESRR